MTAEAVTGRLRFLKRTSPTPIYQASEGGGGAKLDIQGEFEERQVCIHDGRAGPEKNGGFALDREGFSQMPHASQVEDFYDDGEIERVYVPELVALLRSATGAVRVVVFDHTRRSTDPAVRQARKTREPTSVVHNDYTDRSARKRLGEIMPADAAALAEQRYAIVNVWRPVRVPAVRWPLTLCDARSIDRDDLVPTERRARGRTGELMLVHFNPRQRWFYFPQLGLDEVLLFKTFDSATDGRARLSIHSSFDTGDVAPGAPHRESIESRAFLFFG